MSSSGTSANANFTGATSSTVVISVVSTNLCGNSNPSKKSVSVNLLCRDTQNDIVDQAMTVFPNPTSGKVTVNFNASAEDRYLVRVVDLLGKVVYSSDVNAVIGLNVKDIDLSNVAKGMYLLNIQTAGGESQTLRLVVE
jgi:Na+-translocating ferredoxin:NAD+ oxidoreductase RnfG subunit